MARVLLISNPLAARHDHRVVHRVRSAFSRKGWEVDSKVVEREGHAAELAFGAAADGVDVVAVYGGDGTTMQAVRGMHGQGIPVGLIPGGTGNLLAGNLRIPRNPEKAVETITDGVTREIDLGRLERSDGDHFFAVACGTGFDARLMAETRAAQKKRWGMGAYVARVFSLIPQVASVTHRVTIDDREIEVEAAMLLVANCSEIIPHVLKLGDGISLDDGLLELVAVKADGVVQSARAVWQLVAGRGNGSLVAHDRGSRITVETADPRPVQYDGEPVGSTPFTAEVVGGGLKVRTPGDR